MIERLGERRSALRAPSRFDRLAVAASAVLLLVWLGQWLVAALTPGRIASYAGIDYTLYMDAARRWLEGGQLYQASQLTGTYDITPGSILYPPVGLWLFVPFTMLPAVFWWLVPLGFTAYALWVLRPAQIVWPILALCVWWPPTSVKLLTGNPVIWVLAAVAAGALYAWPFVFALLKPSLFPFAFLGLRSRSWWLALAAFVLACLPFGGLWADWVRALLNSRGGGVLYSIEEVPLLLLPCIAALGSTRTRHARSPGHLEELQGSPSTMSPGGRRART